MKEPGNPKRRKLLLGLGLGGAGAAAVLAAGTARRAGKMETASTGQEDEKGYRLTEHVRSYYRTAGI